MSDPAERSARATALSPARRQLLERWRQGRDASSRQGIARLPASSPPVLSFAQERLWLIDRLLGPGNAYNTVPSAVRLRGPLDVAALERSLAEVVRRHEVLRTTVAVTDGRPRPVVAPAGEVSLLLDDLSDRADPESAAMEIARAAATRPFDLASGPLLQVRLLRLGPDLHLLVLAVHHLVYDGWSQPVLFRDLTAIYEAVRDGRPSPLPPLAVQYSDYAAWQRERLGGEAVERLLGYWRRVLAGAVSALELPIDHPRPRSQRFRAATYPIDVTYELTARLKALGQRERVTMFMTVLATLQVLLARYSGQEDVIVGSPIAGRTQPELEGMIGCFINTLVLRTNLSGDPTFTELLGRVREVALGAYAHQDLPFERLVEDVQPDRDTSRNPLFQVMFALQGDQQTELEVAGLRLSPVPLDNGVAKFDLTFDLRERDGALHGHCQFDADLFEPATCRRIMDSFHELLAGIANDPGARLSDLPVIAAAERRQMLVEWNATAREHDIRCMHELVAAQAARDPGAVAVVAPDGRLTYGELEARANALAERLRGLGVGPDTVVGLCVRRSLALPAGILGIMKAGGAYLPLDPEFPRERLAYMLADAGSPVVVTGADVADVLPPTDARLVLLTEGPGIPSAPAVPALTPDHLAYVMYTSGSTGLPKGVMISHRAVANMMLSTLEHIDARPSDVVLQFATFCFDVSVLEIFTALCSGGRLVIPSRETTLVPAALTSLMERERVTICDIPPAVLELLPPDSAPSLRIQFLGCEAFTGSLATRWQAPGRRVINGYGPTEATVMMTLMELEGVYEQMPPIGYSMPNHRAYVLDARMRPVPIGVPGELLIGGTGLARGYLNRPGLTAERFVPDPFDDSGQRLYRTGDLARFLPNGALEFLGRADAQVKIRGYRIEVGEVETVAAQHPDVQQVVVVAHEPTPGSRQLVAYLSERPGASIDVGELRAWLGQRLPGYMVPQLFVRMDRLPLAPSGKVDRSALPVPDMAQTERARAYAAPQTELEQFLAGDVFAQVLGVDRVGVHDNFFELGGNSLQIAQVQSQISESLDVEVPLRMLFEAPTIAQLTEFVDSLTHVAAPPAQDADEDREEGEI